MSESFRRISRRGKKTIPVGHYYEQIIHKILENLQMDYSHNVKLGDLEYKVDFVFPSENAPEQVIAVFHFTQRNYKEKFYRTLNEFFETKVMFPRIRFKIIMIGLPLGKEGWLKLLPRIFDGTLFTGQFKYHHDLVELAKEYPKKPKHFSKMPAREFRGLLTKKGLDDFVDDVQELVFYEGKEEKWPEVFEFFEERKRILNTSREKYLRVNRQTTIRWGLLRTLSINPSLRGKLRSLDFDFESVNPDEIETLRQLKLLNTKKTLGGIRYEFDGPTESFMRKYKESDIKKFFQRITEENPIYKRYFDDLYEPERIRSMVNFVINFLLKNGTNANSIATLLSLGRNTKNLANIPHETIWVLDVLLAIVRMSRNQIDQLCGQRSKRFPKARNVLGRYMYRDMRDRVGKLSIQEYETLLGNLFSELLLNRAKDLFTLDRNEVFKEIFEDRVYSLMVIQTPRPLDIIVEDILDDLEIEYKQGESVESLYSSLASEVSTRGSGRLGKIPFSFAFKIGNKKFYLRVMSAYEGHVDKRKEQSAKIRGVRLSFDGRKIVPVRGIGTIMLMDGFWSAKDQEILFLAGYDYICDIYSLRAVLNELKKS